MHRPDLPDDQTDPPGDRTGAEPPPPGTTGPHQPADSSDGPQLYPLGLLLTGCRVLVVGGGSVATRRVPALVAAGADIVLVSPELTPALRAHADAGRLRWLPRRFEPADLDGAWLVQVAVDDPAAAAAVSAAAAQRRIFCVRADDRTAGTAWTPAVTRHGPVTVAVHAGGRPRLAMAVRDAVRDRLAAGTLRPATVDVAGTVARGDAGGAGDTVARGDAVDTVARSDGVDTVARSDGGDTVPPAEAPASGEPAEPAVARRGSVALVGSGPGDPELITVRGRRLLAEADVVVADRLVPGILLDELGPDVELVDASKIPYGPSRTQEEINRILVDRARAGRFVVRLKGGDPYLFGRGGEEVLACADAGVPVTVVPGVTSALAVPAAAGIPVTHRGVAHELVVVSGHLPPGHPDSRVDWAALGRLRGTVCVLMGLKNLAAITAALADGGRPAHTPAAVVQEGTTAAQRIVRATLGTVAAAVTEHGVRPPAVVVLGDVVQALAAWHR